ncbi:MAG: hypothetical protein ACKO38_12695 [Planctomycetota bacterium]
MAEFSHAVRQRTPIKASGDVAHRSRALVQLGEIAFRTRGRLDFDPEAGRFIGCDEANALLVKERRQGTVLWQIVARLSKVFR